MKAAMQVAGIIDNATVRPPTHAPNTQEEQDIRAAVKHAGLLQRAIA